MEKFSYLKGGVYAILILNNLCELILIDLWTELFISIFAV